MTIQPKTKSCPCCGAVRIGKWFQCGSSIGKWTELGCLLNRSAACIESQIEIINDSLAHALTEAEDLDVTPKLRGVLESAHVHINMILGDHND